MGTYMSHQSYSSSCSRLLQFVVRTPEVLLRPALLVELAQPDRRSHAAIVRGRRRVLLVLVISADGDHHMIEVLAEQFECFIDHLLLNFGHGGKVRAKLEREKRKVFGKWFHRRDALPRRRSPDVYCPRRMSLRNASETPSLPRIAA